MSEIKIGLNLDTKQAENKLKSFVEISRKKDISITSKVADITKSQFKEGKRIATEYSGSIDELASGGFSQTIEFYSDIFKKVKDTIKDSKNKLKQKENLNIPQLQFPENNKINLVKDTIKEEKKRFQLLEILTNKYKNINSKFKQNINDFINKLKEIPQNIKKTTDEINRINKKGSNIPSIHNINMGGGLSNIFGSLGASLPYVGALFAVLGGAIKLISDIGQRTTQAQMSQMQTWFTLGGYRGGGGGYFFNEDIAQAMVEFAKERKYQSVKEIRKGINFSTRELQYSAFQQIPIQEYASIMGIISKNTNKTNEQLLQEFRKYFSYSGASILGESDYLRQIAEHTKWMREQGFDLLKDNLAIDYAKFSSIMTKAFGEERAKVLSQNLYKQSLMADRGGLIGTLSLMANLQKTGDIFEAYKLTEQGKGLTETLSLFSGMNKLASFMLLRNQGITTSDIEKLSKFNFNKAMKQITIATIKPEREIKNIQPLQAIANQNLINQTYATSQAGLEAQQISTELLKMQLDLVNALGPVAKDAKDFFMQGKTMYNDLKNFFKGINSAADFIEKLSTKIGEKIKFF